MTRQTVAAGRFTPQKYKRAARRPPIRHLWKLSDQESKTEIVTQCASRSESLRQVEEPGDAHAGLSRRVFFWNRARKNKKPQAQNRARSFSV
jgi:hypothetical protein